MEPFLLVDPVLKRELIEKLVTVLKDPMYDLPDLLYPSFVKQVRVPTESSAK